MKNFFFSTMISAFVVASSITTASSQESMYWQIGGFAGVSSPQGTYKKDFARAKRGYVAGLFMDYYFLGSNLGVGFDARIMNNPHDVPDTIYSASKDSYTFNRYSSAKRFRHVAITIGPTYQFQTGNLILEAYAKGGMMFQQFPTFLRMTTHSGGPPTTGNPSPLTFTITERTAQTEKAKAWSILTGARINYNVASQLAVFAFGDYQAAVGKKFFGKPSQFTVSDAFVNSSTVISSTNAKMLNFGLGLKYRFGSFRDPSELREN